jgi:actin cytoskeleton-regulatory complex protein PAN1
MSQWGQGQPQPGYQYPMQTGFPGANPQFHQNPQFQQQPNPQFTFMPPNIPNIPAPYSAGGLPQLQPQPTPQFFMPANISAPYSAAGLPQLQPPPQQLGGLSLQQSFQQHNQAQRGNTAPKIPQWALSKAEKKHYDQIFRAWDPQSTGFISGQTALEVFGQSGLDKNDLARIWYMSCH